MNETPNTVHGRLLESAHIAGYTFKRAWDELRWLLEDERWQQLGFSDGAAFAESIYGLFSEFRGTVEQRKEVANALAGIASQRAIAKVLGVGTGTVARDLGAPSGARQAAKPKESEATEAQAAPNGAPWFADDADPTKLAKLREKSKKKRDERQALHATLAKQNAALPISERKYSAIYADPPWRFETWGELGKTLSAEAHYPTLDLEGIKALPVADLAADHCALFLWVTMPMLPQTFSVIEAWGFTYKTCAFTWIKQNRSGKGLFTGMGYWTLANAELCLLATKGEPMRVGKDMHQVIMSPVAEHSRKPDEAAARIERLVGGPYLELFARAPRKNWDAWGNQVEQTK